jgi:cytochrome b561
MSSSRAYETQPAAATHAGSSSAAPKSQLTRVLHLLMLLMVLHQLFGSLLFSRLHPGEQPSFLYLAHEYVGVVGLGAVTAFWLWTLLRDERETPLTRLFPWFSPRGWGAVLRDARQLLADLLAIRAPSLDLDSLSSAVHGLGLLTATYMALSGALWWFWFDGTSWGRFVMGTHHLVSNLMWAYLVAHVGFAVLHRLLGEDLFQRMFWPRPRR